MLSLWWSEPWLDNWYWRSLSGGMDRGKQKTVSHRRGKVSTQSSKQQGEVSEIDLMKSSFNHDGSVCHWWVSWE